VIPERPSVQIVAPKGNAVRVECIGPRQGVVQGHIEHHCHGDAADDVEHTANGEMGRDGSAPIREGKDREENTTNSGSEKTVKNHGLITVTLISCIAAMPCSGCRRPSAFMMNVENAKKMPATKALPRAEKRIMTFTNVLLIAGSSRRRALYVGF
jgi:hypothetical protein